MEKNEKYLSPECEEVEIKIEGCIAVSDPGEGGSEGEQGGEWT